MKNLIIIGNGFDLAHDLKTNYTDFKSDIKEHPEKYEILSINNNLLLASLLNGDKELWSDIESAYFDILVHIKDRVYLQNNYSPVNRYTTVKHMNDDFEKIKEALCLYLLSQEKNFSPIVNYQNLFNEFNGRDTVVVNFNYTKTVSEYLLDKDIELIHIHGELEKEDNPIIFGYAADHKESKKLLTQNNNDFVRNIKKFNYLFTNNETLLKKHLNSEEYNVFVLGHSCGISDGLVLSQIFMSSKIHQIIPFYFKDKVGYFNTMVNLDRVVDDYSELEKDRKSFNKLLSFPDSHVMPQKKEDPDLVEYLSNILNRKLPLEEKLNVMMEADRSANEFNF